MTQKKTASLMVLLCVACGAMPACDEAGDPAEVEAAMPSELGTFEVGMWPPADATRDANVEYANAFAPASSAAGAGLGIFPTKNIEPTDQLMIDWVRWALAQPFASGSIADPTGEQCGLGQAGPVWYLAGTFGGPVTRECDIPNGKQLFFPLVNNWILFPAEWYTDPSMIDTDLPFIEDWYDKIYADICGLTLRIDGKQVLPDQDALHEQLYIRVMEPFAVDLHAEHKATQWFAGGVTMPAVGAGHYALIQPLTPGEHVLELGGSICGEYPFSTSATYLLHVGN